MKNYTKFKEPTIFIILQFWVLMNLLIYTNHMNLNNSTMIHENLEHVILKGMKEIFSKMNVNYKYNENLKYIHKLVSQNKLKNSSYHFRLEFTLGLNNTEISLYKTSPKSSLRRKQLLVRKLIFLDKSILDLERDFTKYNHNEPLKQARIMFFEIIIPKFLHILETISYNLEIDLLSNKRKSIYSKSFNMTNNQKIIKLVDFDDLLNPNLDDLLRNEDFQNQQKRLFLNKNKYKFNRILSLIMYESSKDYIDNPCYLNGYYTSYPKILGSGDFSKCYGLIKQVIKKLNIEKNKKLGQFFPQKVNSIFLSSEFEDIFTVLNKTNITLNQLREESQHYCDLRYQFLMFLFENDKNLVDSICFKMSYSIILIEKIVNNNAVNLVFERNKMNKKAPLSALLNKDLLVIDISSSYKLAITIIPLETILLFVCIIFFSLILYIFEAFFVKSISWMKNKNKISKDRENNEKIMMKLIDNKRVKELFIEKGPFRREIIEFENEVVVFTYSGYTNFLLNLVQTNDSFKKEIQKIFDEEIYDECYKIIQIIQISLMLFIGFIINEFFEYLSVVNDQFEEKKHLIFIIFSCVYFSILIYSLKNFDLSQFFMKKTMNYSDEKSGSTLKI